MLPSRGQPKTLALRIRDRWGALFEEGCIEHEHLRSAYYHRSSGNDGLPRQPTTAAGAPKLLRRSPGMRAWGGARRSAVLDRRDPTTTRPSIFSISPPYVERR